MNADLGSGTPEQIQTIVKDFWSAQEPILTSMEPAPDPIKADVATLLALAHQGASTSTQLVRCRVGVPAQLLKVALRAATPQLLSRPAAQSPTSARRSIPLPHRSSACWSQPNANGLVVAQVGPLVEGKRRELDRRDVCPGDPTGQRANDLRMVPSGADQNPPVAAARTGRSGYSIPVGSGAFGAR